MFTGLVETTAVVRQLRRAGDGARLGLGAKLGRLVLGESVSVNGACLTVVRHDRSGFEADVSAETLARTTIGALRVGDRVNVERATRLGDRLGGHIVAGHVDGVGHVGSIEPGRSTRRVVVHAPGEVQRLLAVKGSVTIDGVSLTINGLVDDGDPAAQGFDVMLVPHTLAHTTLLDLAVGQRVNLEADVLARYVARQLEIASRAKPPKADRPGRASSPRARAASATRGAKVEHAHADQRLLEQLREGGFLG